MGDEKFGCSRCREAREEFYGEINELFTLASDGNLPAVRSVLARLMKDLRVTFRYGTSAIKDEIEIPCAFVIRFFESYDVKEPFDIERSAWNPEYPSLLIWRKRVLYIKIREFSEENHVFLDYMPVKAIENIREQ